MEDESPLVDETFAALLHAVDTGKLPDKLAAASTAQAAFVDTLRAGSAPSAASTSA